MKKVTISGRFLRWMTLVACWLIVSCAADEDRIFDVLIHDGEVYDGTGAAGFRADIGIVGDRIVAIGNLNDAPTRARVDASGMAVSPGFINMLSWGVSSLIIDGKGQSDIRQGVTLEVFGEGISMGPLNDTTRAIVERGLTGHPHDAPWTTLGEYLEYLEAKGVAPNIASFIGASNVRISVIGEQDRQPTADELIEMQSLVAVAMREGAMGVASALIYAPGAFADTDELIALAEVAAEFDGMYVSHIRSESDALEQAVEELIQIAETTGVRAEIYHLKASGARNWSKFDRVFELVETARSDGIKVSANMYPYVAGATGLDASMPLWVQEGGTAVWIERLQKPAIRARVIEEMISESTDWENLFQLAGPDGMVFESFRNDDLKPYIGQTLSEVASSRGTSPAETAIDIVIADGSRVGVLYFLMSEDNVRKAMAKPWVSFGSDAPAQAPEGVFLESGIHPRAYGTFSRVLGTYVREHGIVTLQEAVRRMTSLPAKNLGIRNRGTIADGYFADMVVFDPGVISDRASFEEPQQYAVGVEHVFVNGVQVLRDGEHTGATPGRAIRGNGWSGEPGQ